MKYWIDTEFIQRPYTIDLISIGLVAEDSREFYAESSEVDWSHANLWTLENVRPQLGDHGIRREEIGAHFEFLLRVIIDPSFGVTFQLSTGSASAGCLAA
jgi:hypothetical protein